MVKWTKKWLRYAKLPKFLVKGHKKVPKCLLSWFFFMMTTTTIISTQIYNVKMTSSKNITNSKVQKQIAKYGFERRFHDFKYGFLNMVFF
jgi:hypothetical protein